MSLDIKPADTEKWYLRIAMNWFIKKYTGGKNSKIIHEEMEDCGNPIIRYCYRLKKKVLSKISSKWQVKMIDQFSEFILWIMYKDTAYRQIFFWSLKQILDNKDELMPIVEKYYVEPEDWYVNAWERSKAITKEQREKGQTSDSDLSYAEKFFVPNLTRQRIENELEKERRKKGL